MRNLIKFLWLGLFLMLTACGGGGVTQATDTDAPVITILGSSPVNIRQWQSYSDQGASATDNIDGNINISIESNVDINLVGSYKVKYTAKDKAGNVSHATRVVNVIEQEAIKENTYSISSKLFNESNDSYKLISISGESPINTLGEANIKLLDIKEEQLIFIDATSLKYPIPVNLDVKNKDLIEITPESITKGFIKLALIDKGVSILEIKKVLTDLSKYSEFNEIQYFISNQTTDLNKVLSDQISYQINKLTLKIINDRLGTSNKLQKKYLHKNIGISNSTYNPRVPYILDLKGNREKFVNPLATFYNVYIDNINQFTLWNDEIDFLKKPNIIYPLSNGYHNISFQKSHGHNMIRLGLYIIKALGTDLSISSEAIAKFGNHGDEQWVNSFKSVGVQSLKDLGWNDIIGLLEEKHLLTKLLNRFAPHLLSGGYFRSLVRGLDFIGRGEAVLNGIPLIQDWIFAPSPVKYGINSENGVLSEGEAISPPFGNFTIDYNTSILAVGDAVTFIPNIKDFKYPNNQLIYSWDFDGDKKEDKRSFDNTRVKYTYQKAGTYGAILNVTNPAGKKYRYPLKIVVNKQNPVASQVISLTSLTPNLISTKKASYKLSIMASGFDSSCDVWIKDKNGKRTLGYKTACNTSSGEITTNIKLPQNRSEVYRIWVTDKIGKKYSNKLTIETKFSTTPQSPSKPAHVIASDSNADFISISGYESASATKYEIYRSTSSSKTSMKKIGETGKIEYKDTTAVLDKKYFYRVKACNSIGCSDLSDQYDPGIRKQKSSETKPSKPSIKSPGSPSSPGVELTNKYPSLSWNSAERATSYWVAIKDVTTNSVIFEKKDIKETSIVSPALTVGHKYFWNISACNGAGCSEWSDSLYFQIKDDITTPTLNKAIALSPGALNALGSEITNKNLGLSFKRIYKATHYWVKVNDITTNTVFYENKNTEFTSFPTQKALSVGHNYKWRVAACNASGCGEWSDYLYFKVMAEVPNIPVPNKPSNLSPGTSEFGNPEKLDTVDITLTWSSVNHATKYLLSVFDYNTKVDLFEDKVVNGTSYDASSFTGFGHSYLWEVKACNTNNKCSSEGKRYFSIKGQVIAPEKPKGLSPGTTVVGSPEIVTGISHTFRWNNTNGANWYKLLIATGRLKAGGKISSGVIIAKEKHLNTNSFSISNLEKGKEYVWWVEACNDDGCTESDYYGMKINAPQVPAPSTPTANVYGTTAIVSWGAVANADEYKIKLYDEDGSDNRAEYTVNTALPFVNLMRGHRYKVKVRAKINSTYGDYSPYKYLSIEEASATPCPLRHFTNNQISEYLQKGYRDGSNGVTQVAELQNFLNEVGYNAGVADGIFGNGTEQAVISYQSANSLGADGKVGINTRNKINSTPCN